MSSLSSAPKGALAGLTSAFQKLKVGATSAAAPVKDKAEEIVLRVTGIYETVRNQGPEYEDLTKQLIFLTTRVLGDIPQHASFSEELRDALDALKETCSEIETELAPMQKNVIERAAQAAEVIERLQKKLDKQSHHLTLAGTVDYMRFRGAGTATMQAEPGRLRPPPKPAIFYGRDELVQSMVDLLLQDETCRIPLLGLGGIGKTSTIATVLHDDRVKAKFGEHMFFLSCEGIVSASGILLALASALGLQHENRVEKALGDFFAARKYVLLVFDNLETVWNADDESQVEKVLAECANISTVSLVITMRGTIRPGGVDWSDAVLDPLDPLPLEAARSMWMKLARKTDSRLDELLRLLDGIPLVIALMAYHGQRMTPTELIQEYDQEPTSLMSHGKPGRLTSFEFSMELSLNCPTIEAEPNARTILSALSILPDGMVTSAVKDILPSLHGSARAVRVLVEVGLAHTTAERLSALTPVRDFIRERYPPSESSLAELCSYFTRLAALADDLVTEFTTSVASTLRSEYGNINGVLLRSWRGSLTLDAAAVLLKATIQLSNFSGQTGHGDSIPLLQRAEITLKDIGDRSGAADCTWSMGDVLGRFSHYDKAMAMFEDAGATYNTIGNRLGAAECTRSMGHILRVLNRNDEAMQKLEDAKATYDAIGNRLGAAQCTWSMSDILRVLSRNDEAMEKLGDAKATYEAIGNRYGAAECTRSMGGLLRMLSRNDEAMEKLQDAKAMYEAIGNRYGAANCTRSMGDILHMLNRNDEAMQKLEDAKATYEAIGNRLGAAECTRSMGDILRMLSRNDEAMEKLQDAKAMYEAIGNRYGAAHCTWSMGDILRMFDRNDEAMATFEDAKSTYEAIGSRTGAAECSASMGDILILLNRLGEAQEHLENAKATFEAIGTREGSARATRSMGNLLRLLNHHDQAMETLEEARATFEAIGSRSGAARCFRYLAMVCIDQGRNSEAESMVERAATLYLEIKRPDEADSCRALLKELRPAGGPPKTEVRRPSVASSTTVAEARREGAVWRACMYEDDERLGQ